MHPTTLRGPKIIGILQADYVLTSVPIYAAARVKRKPLKCDNFFRLSDSSSMGRHARPNVSIFSGRNIHRVMHPEALTERCRLIYQLH
jgi:hypothetical protein